MSSQASWILHTEITLFQLFSPFAGKMEKQLRSLAAFLGECSRIVSQVLDSSDSSSNGNMTRVYQQIAGEQPALFQVQSNELDLCLNVEETEGGNLA